MFSEKEFVQKVARIQGLLGISISQQTFYSIKDTHEDNVFYFDEAVAELSIRVDKLSDFKYFILYEYFHKLFVIFPPF